MSGRLEKGLTEAALAKLPPSAPDAEQAALGAMLMEREALRAGAEVLDGNDFYTPGHAHIFDALHHLAMQGQPADLVLVEERLRELDLLEDVGGPPYLTELLEAAPTAAMLPHYATILRRKTAQRRVRAASIAYVEAPDDENLAALRGAAAEGGESAPPLAVTAWPELVRDTIPEVPWQIEGILPERGLGSLTADTGVGKTWLLADLALSVAAGELVWGQFALRRPGPVLYLDEESGAAELSRRFSKLAHGRGLAERGLPVFALSYASLKVDDPQGLDALLRLVREHRPAVVILDSLIRFHSQDENSNSGMARVTAALRRLTQEGPAVLSAHHPRKLGGIGISNASIERGRGAKEGVAGLDSYLFARRTADAAINVEIAKLRHGLPRRPFTLRVEDDPHGSTSVCHPAETDASGQKTEQARAVILTSLMDAGGVCDRPALETACKAQGIGDRWTSDTLAEMTKLGLIRPGQLRDRKRLYHLTPAGQEGLTWE